MIMKSLSKRVGVFPDRYKDILTDVSLAWFPWVIAFLYIPASLYLPNQAEFDHDLFLLIPYFCLLVFSFLLSLLLWLLPDNLRRGTARFFFSLGLFIIFTDSISAHRLTVMTGFETESINSGGAILPDLAVLLAVAILYWRLPWSGLRRTLALFVWLASAIEVVVLLFSLSPLSHVGEADLHLRLPPQDNQRGNIYQIVLDSYNRDLFPGIIKKHQLTDAFSGFYLFQNNRSNYLFTKPSVASYLTGTFYQGGSLFTWLDTWKRSGLIGNLTKTGYAVSVYAVTNYWLPSSASNFTSNEQILGAQGRYLVSASFADLWLLRLVPDSLHALLPIRQGVFRHLFEVPQVFATSDILVRRTITSVGLIKQFIKDEEKRPSTGQYVYLHAYLPHIPFVFDENCSLVPKSNYIAQSVCATRLVADFLDQLKALGRYRQATIIIQSDHAFQFRHPPEVKDVVAKRIGSTNLRAISFAAVDQLSHALFMIKPPQRDEEPLLVSNLPTQLADIPATVYDLLGISVRAKVGTSVFSPDFPTERKRDIYVGFLQADKEGAEQEFGKTLKRGEMNHYSYSTADGWRIHDNIPAQW